MMIRRVVLADAGLLAIGASAVPPVQAASTPSLWAPGETPVLSCGVGGLVAARHICTTEAANEGYPKMHDFPERADHEPLDMPCCGQR